MSVWQKHVFVTVSCQIQDVEGLIGDNVLLPCVHESGSDKMSVSWTDKDDNPVFDTNENKPELSSQSKIFKDRVESFPEQYKTGNFSIILKNISQSDSGVYNCSILDVNRQYRVSLTVSGQFLSVINSSHIS